ncbi:alpha/beta fold hydrolase [Streptomyces sp. NPDC016562]|uniref:alpha/beta fold hydrolase n=1 Tax=Streptomyces sp. NPDC016562 TaxID=3364966 RepID=UPI0036FDA9D7
MVLLHGQSATPAEWGPHVGGLAEDGRRVLALDRVGEPGYSTQTREIGDAADTAAWLEEALTELGLDRVHLIGRSCACRWRRCAASGSGCRSPSP